MRILILLAAMITSLSMNAQQINGVVKDADDSPIVGTTVSLLKDTGRTVVKLAVSKESGAYSFENIQPGKYRVSASHIGFTPAVSGVFELSGEKATAPELKLARASAQMNNVTITATKPIVEVKADKTILNVEGTINSVGSDALELLRKSPGVMVDKDENLSVNGKNGVQVYIDGRPTPLSGQDLSNYLKSIQSSNIEAIEIITNPSAKYEAAGNAGIINIRLKKNKSLGTNGSVNAGYNIGHYPKYNAGINLNYRNKTMNIYGSYGYNNSQNRNRLALPRTVLDSLFDQSSAMKIDNSSHNFKAGVDYFIDKKNTLGVMVNGTLSDPSISNYSRTVISYIPTGVVDRILIADNKSDLKRNNVNYNLNYSFNGTDGKSLMVNADYGKYNIGNDQYQPNSYYDASEQTVLKTSATRMEGPTDISIKSLKADWEQNYLKGKLGFGGKIGFVKTNNNFQRFNIYPGSEDLDVKNLFDYKENINAGYVNYNRQLKGVMIQAGLRVENTVSEGVSTGETKNGSSYDKFNSDFKRNYTDFFPSAAVTFNKNPMNQMSVTYSRRIDRPAYQSLNPFEFRLDDYTFQKGNINLRPQYTNSFGITHTYKYRLNTTLNYSHIKDLSTQWIDTIDRSKSFITQRNLASQDIVSLNMSYPFSYKSYTVFGNMNTNYAKYKANLDGRKVDLSSFGFSFYAQNSLKFAKTWTAELTGFYNAPTIYQGAFKAKSLWSVDAGLQKQVLAGKGTVKASFSDIFNSLHFRGTTEFAGQTTHVNVHWESQQFKLNFVYRFGSNQVKAARNRNTGAEEETKRTQGRTGLNIGQ